MNAKAKLKIVLDVAMTLALLFLMGYPWWGDVAHEWAGAGMFALFIAHHILNAGWWRSLTRGRYTPARVFQLVIDLLVFLASNKGIALSREKILQKVWNYDYFGEDRTVDTHVKMLRGHLGACRSYIVTVWGIGYKFDPDARR